MFSVKTASTIRRTVEKLADIIIAYRSAVMMSKKVNVRELDGKHTESKGENKVGLGTVEEIAHSVILTTRWLNIPQHLHA